ncbi:PAS domain S-box protein [Scytonema sp. UIC 10036]|uniref:hybrid sensor histidine kinase/response regulator n=1 Tax=Scytonema sp. UIC 10036 TaxID=2304196 RepID=UPI0012DA968E|nr:PAS domain S-box protein [Scytonema sp. UIC 10036]MUG99757.1 PAS domain S-box protein [Scytonema sp. UIC 10036]
MLLENEINILLVDDCPNNLFLIEAMLNHLKHNLVQAFSGKEALECILNQDFALILLDIQMPELNGFETAKLIRQCSRTQHTPIIFITAFCHNIHQILQGYSLGAVDYLIKPIVPEILVSKVQEFVELFRQTQRIKQQHKLIELTNQNLRNEVLQRQQVQEALLFNQQRLQYLLFHNPAIIYCYKAFDDFITTFVSDNITQKLGYTVQNVKGDPMFWINHIHPEDAPCMMDKLPGLLKTGKQIYEYRFLHRDGTYRWIRDESKLIRDAFDNPLEVISSMIDISERKQAEEALQESESELRDFLDSAHDLIQSFSPEGKLLYVNRAWQETMGYTLEEVKHLSIFDTIHPNCLEKCQETMESVMAGIPCDRIETHFVTKDGRTIALEGNVNCRFEAGQPQTTTGIFRNITDRKQAEDALQIQRQWLEVILNSIGDGVIATDKAAKITFMNPVAQALTGCSVQDALGRKIDEVFCIIHQRRRRSAASLIEKVLQEPKVIELVDNLVLVARNGNEIPIDNTLAPILTPDGLLQGTVLVFRDITRRRQAKATLYRALQELEFQKFALDQSASVAITDAQGTITYANDKFCELSQYSRQELLGQSHSLINSGFHPKQFFQKLWTTITRGQVWKGEIRNKAKDGSCYWVDTTIVPFLDSQGKPYQYLAIRFDITQRKQAEESLCEALEKEKELNELKSRFVSMISHEFRTPLTTILGTNELLTHYSQNLTEEKKLAYLQRIHNNVKHLTQMLDDVLLLGKAEAGKLDLQPETLDIVQLCQSLVDELKLSSASKHQLEFTANSPSIIAYVDEKLLRHILGNLLLNAIKYSPAGSIICFELTCVGDKAQFQIQDSGIGIPEEDKLKLFESFHRGTNVSNIAGTGLGLAIVKKAVDVLGGDIAVNSKVNMGATFTVTIPLNER